MAFEDKFVDEQEYISMITKKTGIIWIVLCSRCSFCPPILMKKIHSPLTQFGENVGIVFQLIDDLIGVIGDPKLTGKSVGNDLREGKKTLPILLALQISDSARREKILRVFASRNASKIEIEEAVKTISRLGIEEAVRDKARQHIRKLWNRFLAMMIAKQRERSLLLLISLLKGRSRLSRCLWTILQFNKQSKK